MEVVYHGSPEGGLTVITPRVSTHNKSYVYATRDVRLATIFLQHWNDFVFNVSYGDGHALEITERYAGALEEVYEGRNGHVYQLDAHSFISNATGFDGEVVSEQVQKVLGCQAIENVYERLLQMNKEGLLQIYRYPNRPKYIPQDDSDLVEMAWEIYCRTGDRGVIAYCISKHPGLHSELTQRMPMGR